MDTSTVLSSKRTASDKTLLLLAQYPLLGSQQIARLTGASESAIEARLHRLRAQELIETVNPKEPILPVRTLHLPTAQGLSLLAETAGESPQEVAKAAGLSRRRLFTLAARIKTTYQARQVLLGLGCIASLFSGWRCMARLPTDHGPFLLDGAATLKHRGRLIQIALELDSGPRAKRQVEKLYQLRTRYPALQLILICWSRRSMQYYLDLIRKESLSLPTSLLPTYAALGSALCEQGYDAPIWYSNYDKRYMWVLGSSVPPEKIVQPWPPQEDGSFNVLHRSITQLADWAANGRFPKTISQVEKLVGFQFASSPLQKQIVDLVARHPLVNETGLAVLLDTLPTSVGPAIQELLQWGFLAAFQEDELEKKCLKLSSSLAIVYLAKREGWEGAVKSYARSRGWKLDVDGELVVSKLERDFDHTRAVHSLLVRLSNDPQVEIVNWTSEPSTRCRFFYGEKWRWVKPDAAGLLRLEGRDFPFLLEWERTTTSIRKLRAKLLYYYRWYLSGYYRVQDPAITVLMVTTGIRRAKTVRKVIADLAQEFDCPPLPLLVTSYKELAAQGLLAPIWQGALDERPRRLAAKAV